MLDRERAGHRYDAFPHADQAKLRRVAQGDAIGRHADTIIRHLDTNSIGIVVRDCDLHLLRLAVADCIAHRFLDNAIDGLLHIFADTILIDRHCDEENNIVPPAAPERRQSTNRGFQPNRLDRSQASKYYPHMTLHPTDRIMNRPAHVSGFRASGTASDALDRRRGHIDRKQQRPDFIMQVPREIGALFRLQRKQPLVQPAVMCCRRGETLRHDVEAICQTRQFRRAMLRHPAAIVPLPIV